MFLRRRPLFLSFEGWLVGNAAIQALYVRFGGARASRAMGTMSAKLIAQPSTAALRD